MNTAQQTRKKEDKNAVEIADEAMHALRNAPLHITAAYFIGSVPFVLGFLYFWADMSRSAFAAERCAGSALGIVFLFLWMKCWQTVFASGMLATIRRGRNPVWSAGRIARMCAVQCAVQPHGLLTIPVALLAMVPFYATHAFYQNMTVLGDGTSADWKSMMQRSYRQARVWPKQNHILLWLFSPWVLATAMLTAFILAWLIMSFVPALRETMGWLVFVVTLVLMFQMMLPISPFGCVVAGNIASLIAIIPPLLGMLGIESFSTPGGWVGMFNSTFMMTVYGVSYLCLDPLIKTAHALRCFYGESQCTGEDLLVELRNFEDERRNQ